MEYARERAVPIVPVPLSEDPLIAALREENAHLRDRTHSLERQLAAAQAAQAEMAHMLRLTAPFRRIQELARLRRQERRRAAEAVEAVAGPEAAPLPVSAVPNPAGGLPGAGATARLAITDAQAARYPLLARTREWASGNPISRPDALPLRTGRTGRVLVIAHVFYPDIWPELARRIVRIPGPFDIVVTLVEDHSDGLLDQIVAQFPHVVIETLPNHGRDMWPFVRVAQLGLIGNYDAVLKIHTKRSVHRLDGAAWRSRLLDALCPSPEGIGLILELLRRDPGIGMVAPAGSVLGQEFWGSNAALVEALALRSGITFDPARVWFPGGSMFWSRPGPLNRLRDAELAFDDFEHDLAVLDSTTAHALERFLGVLVADSSLGVIGTDEVASRLAAARASDARALQQQITLDRVPALPRIVR